VFGFVLTDIAYWILLGFLSSAGIGFGFHTFVLYVLPAISSYCITNPTVLFLETFIKFMPIIYSWGFGSALGECTSYIAGYYGTEKYESPRIERLLKKYSFALITLSGSVPNNFFDVLGIVAGAIRLPFMDFFLPTVCGKALIKPTLQLAMSVVLLNKNTQSALIYSFPKQYQSQLWFWFDSYEKLREPSELWNGVMVLKDVIVFSLVAYFAVKGINRVANDTRKKLISNQRR
jgi:membrane protein YqaA with SNARE-associated domain